MTEPVIKVESVSKRFQLGQSGNSPLTRLAQMLTAKGRRERANNEFWALKDVDFEVQAGEVLGIIGRNGAGKSTLLKILSRISHPTEGLITMRGRVASLLEVGTGFHPELSGRENIFLNGSILGMTHAEIRSHFDEIVDFAGIERFLDTPVKRYSSGMYVRLAFAVAAHLEPEILIVDEVLAVGDVAFQQKCMGRMKKFANGGRTVLFVSHNLAAINHFCERAIRIHEGKLTDEGDPRDLTARYIAEYYSADKLCEYERDPSKPMQIRSIELRGLPEGPGGVIQRTKPFEVIISYDVNQTMSGAEVGFVIERSDGTQVIETRDTDSTESPIVTRQPGHYQARVEFPGQLLNIGTFSIRAMIEAGVGLEKIDSREAMVFDLQDDSGEIAARTTQRTRNGVLYLGLPWATSVADPNQPIRPHVSEEVSTVVELQ